MHPMQYSLTSGELDPPAEPSVIDNLPSKLGANLPADYLDFLRHHNGGEGFLGEEYIILWRAEELAQLNKAYEAERYAPAILLFGSSGGGEAYGFDTHAEPACVVRLPFIGMERRHLGPVTRDFTDLFSRGAALSMREQHRPLQREMELVEIKPIIFGGDPVDPENKMWVTREQHIELVRYWNRQTSTIREQSK